MGCILFGKKHKRIKFIGQSIIAGCMLISGVTLLATGILTPLGSAFVAGGVALVIPFSVQAFKYKKPDDEESKD